MSDEDCPDGAMLTLRFMGQVKQFVAPNSHTEQRMC